MLDEIAHTTGKDPVALRLELLEKQPRAAAVVGLAAEKPAGTRHFQKEKGVGAALPTIIAFETRVAMVAEVQASEKHIQVERVVAVVDCGVPINPDVVTAQVEGAIGFAMSMVLRNQVTLDKGRVAKKFRRLRTDAHARNAAGRSASGEFHRAALRHGEPGVSPLVPAIGNALFSATGNRVRGLPFGRKTLAVQQA